MKRNKTRLKCRIIEIFGNQKAFASACRLSLVALSRKINGQTALTLDDVKAWGNLLDIPPKDYVKFFFDES